MNWFKRKPKHAPSKTFPNQIEINKYTKGELPMSTKDQTEEKPFDPYEYGGHFINWLATPEEIALLRSTTSQQEYDELMGKIKYIRGIEREEEAKKAEALAAEKAKTHWATVMLYNNPIPHEAEAAKLDEFMDRMHHNHSYNEFKMVPLHMFNEGVKFVRLKDIHSIHFTEEYMKERSSANERVGIEIPYPKMD